MRASNLSALFFKIVNLVLCIVAYELATSLSIFVVVLSIISIPLSVLTLVSLTLLSISILITESQIICDSVVGKGIRRGVFVVVIVVAFVVVVFGVDRFYNSDK